MISEDSLHIFFDAMPIGIWRQNDAKKFEWANTAFCRIAGYTLNKLQGMETFDLVKPNWRKFVMDRNKAILKGDVTGPYDFPTRTKDKEELIVMGTIATIGEALYGGYIAPILIDQEQDTVSGLMNEIVFYRELREAVAACYRGSRPPFTLMAISIDRYKEMIASVGTTSLATVPMRG